MNRKISASLIVLLWVIIFRIGVFAEVANPNPDILAPGQTLELNGGRDSLWSLKANWGYFRLFFQNDGNLVNYWWSDTNAQPIQPVQPVLWNSKTLSPNPGRHVVLNASDGNLIVYDQSYKPLWNLKAWAHIQGDHPNAWLRLNNDGDMILYSKSGDKIWALSDAVALPDFDHFKIRWRTSMTPGDSGFLDYLGADQRPRRVSLGETDVHWAGGIAGTYIGQSTDDPKWRVQDLIDPDAHIEFEGIEFMITDQNGNRTRRNVKVHCKYDEKGTNSIIQGWFEIEGVDPKAYNFLFTAPDGTTWNVSLVDVKQWPSAPKFKLTKYSNIPIVDTFPH